MRKPIAPRFTHQSSRALEADTPRTASVLWEDRGRESVATPGEPVMGYVLFVEEARPGEFYWQLAQDELVLDSGVARTREVAKQEAEYAWGER